MEIMGKNIAPLSKDIAHISNRLIESHYKHQLTAQEIKMISWIITEVQRENHFAKRPSDKYVNNIIQISAKEYTDMLGVKLVNFARDAKKMAGELTGKTTTIESNNGWKVISWISYMEYVKDEAAIKIKLSDEIIPYIVNLPLYTKFKLENILRLDSFYAIRIYMLLIKFNGDDDRASGERTFNIAELRLILGISNPTSYLKYNDFKKRVLGISKREINNKTDLTINYSEIKNGKKVEAIKFKITQKKQEANMIEAKTQQS